MTAIITNEGQRVTICHDSEFADLLREKIGDHAAEFYQNRVEELTTSIEEAIRILEDKSGRFDPIDAVMDLKMTLQYQGWDV